MAVRNEAVRLSLIDDFSTPTARAAASAHLLDRALDNLDGSTVRVSKSSSGLVKSDSLPAIGRQAAAAGHEVDRFSGRLRLAVDAVTALGPALVPLGAAGVGGLAGVASQALVAGSALGVTVLALSGLGDGLDALNAYQLEPTQANLAKLHEEFERLGPAGREFVTYLDSIGPQLKSLQMASRAGFLPGAQEGIDELLEALPQVRRYVRDVSETLGDLSADAGADLTSEEWRPFFEFVRSDGIRLLDQMSRSAGNVSQGLANMLAGFAQVSRDFSGGLLELTERFADWSTGLDDDARFQDFVAALQRSGPQALDFLGSFVDLLAKVVEAAAPIGEVTLPLITDLVDVLATLAGSDLGTPLLATAAGLAALNRASAGIGAIGRSNLIQKNYVTPIKQMRAVAPSIGQVGTYFYRLGQDADRASTKTLAARSAVRGFARDSRGLVGGAALLGGVAVAATGVADGMGLSNTASLALMGTIAGPWGAAIGGATGLMLDLRKANNDVEKSLRGVNDAIADGDRDRLREEISVLNEEIGKQSAWDDFTGRTNLLKTSLNEAQDALFTLDVEAGNAGGLGTLMGQPLGLAAEFEAATMSVQDFAASFADLNSLLERNGSLVNYERAIDNLTEAMKKSTSFNEDFEDGRQNIELLDGVMARAIERSQVLQEAGDGLGAMRILRRAKQDLLEFGKQNENAMRFIRPMIHELDRLSRQEVKPKADLDAAPLDSKLTTTEDRLNDLQARLITASVTGDVSGVLQSLTRAERKLLGITREQWRAIVRGDVSDAVAGLQLVQSLRDAIKDKTIYIRTIRIEERRDAARSSLDPGVIGGTPKGEADGGTVPKTGMPYADRHLYLLADGEEVTSNRFGQADTFRDVLKAINAGRSRATVKGMLADGGTAGGRDVRAALSLIPQDRGISLAIAMAAASVAKLDKPVRSLRERLREATRAVDQNRRSVEKEQRQRDAAVAKRDEVASTVSSGLRSDLFAAPDNVWAASANGDPNATLDFDISRGREVARLVKILRSKGLDEGALAELVSQAIANDDLSLLRTYAEKPRRALAAFEQRYELRDQILHDAGMTIGNAAWGADVRAQTKELRQARGDLRGIEAEVRELRKDVKNADKENRKGHKSTADKAGNGDRAARAGAGRAPR